MKFERNCNTPEARNFVQNSTYVPPVAGRIYAKAVAKTTSATAAQTDLTCPSNFRVASHPTPIPSTSTRSAQTEAASITLTDTTNTKLPQLNQKLVHQPSLLLKHSNRLWVEPKAFLKCFSSRDSVLLPRAFRKFVRPLLEFLSVTWSPHYKTGT
jgi:hypothetical protein